MSIGTSYKPSYFSYLFIQCEKGTFLLGQVALLSTLFCAFQPNPSLNLWLSLRKMDILTLKKYRDRKCPWAIFLTAFVSQHMCTKFCQPKLSFHSSLLPLTLCLLLLLHCIKTAVCLGNQELSEKWYLYQASYLLPNKATYKGVSVPHSSSSSGANYQAINHHSDLGQHNWETPHCVKVDHNLSSELTSLISFVLFISVISDLH